MKRYLFLDNFRGFSNTVVPLADVNFLVGENSTGKTSVLTLLRLFSAPGFLMGSDAATEDIQLGHFNELVSVHAKDKSYFRIGLIQEVPESAPAVTGLLLTYRQDQGIPQIYRATSIINDKQVDLRYDADGKLFYRLLDIDKYGTAEALRNDIEDLLESHCSETVAWNRLEIPEGFGRQVPLLLAINFAYYSTTKASKEKHLVFFGPPFGPPLIWIAPIRTQPRRTYDEPRKSFSSDGSHTPYLIRSILASSERDKKKRFEEFMERAGRASGLFEQIETKSFGAKDDPTAPFEVDAVWYGKALNLSWAGYGVSQSLPILVEVFERPPGSWFAIQQPEVHLHPRAQAALGDVFFEMAMREKKHFLIETHSDFTIDRFRMNYRRKRASKARESIPEGQVLFFEWRGKHNTVTPLRISKAGELPSDQPDGYREFFIKEELALIEG